MGDLDAIAGFIALEDPVAASALVARVFDHVGQVAEHPESDRRSPELGWSRYRQIVEPPRGVFYPYDGRAVFIVHVMRTEHLFR